MKNISRTTTYVICGILLFIVGVYVGYAHGPAIDKVTSVANKNAAFASDADFAEYWKVWQLVDEKFPNASKTDAQDRIYGSIKGLLGSLGDPYTTFFTPSENTQFETQVSGAFDGIGLDVGMKNDILTVIAPIKGTPGDKAGIKAGDAILKIGDTSTADLSVDAAVDLMRGKAGTTVTLTLGREGSTDPIVITVTRDTIQLPTVDTKDVPAKSAFVITLYTFTDQSPQLFSKALGQFVATGEKNLIIDLRNDPGGYLDAAVAIAGNFLSPGDVVVKEIGKDPDTDTIVHRSKGPQIIHGKNIYVLVNKGSASASEILAGALSEHHVAKLIGERTFGKGSVQEVVPLENNTSLKITVAKWYTPNGVSISEKGLTPQVELKQDVTPTDANPDPVLTEALALIK